MFGRLFPLFFSINNLFWGIWHTCLGACCKSTTIIIIGRGRRRCPSDICRSSHHPARSTLNTLCLCKRVANGDLIDCTQLINNSLSRTHTHTSVRNSWIQSTSFHTRIVFKTIEINRFENIIFIGKKREEKTVEKTRRNYVLLLTVGGGGRCVGVSIKIKTNHFSLTNSILIRHVVHHPSAPMSNERKI